MERITPWSRDRLSPFVVGEGRVTHQQLELQQLSPAKGGVALHQDLWLAGTSLPPPHIDANPGIIDMSHASQTKGSNDAI